MSTMQVTPFNIQAVSQVLHTGRGAQWVYGDHVSLYFRVAYHRTGDRIRQTLDIANVTVTESEQNQGRFTEVLDDLELQVTHCPTASAIFVENVQTPRFAEFWRARGYLETGESGIAGQPCFYKVFNTNQTDLKGW